MPLPSSRTTQSPFVSIVCVNIRSTRREEEEGPVAFIRPRVGRFRLCVPVTVPLIIAKRYLRRIRADTKHCCTPEKSQVFAQHNSEKRDFSHTPVKRPQLFFFFYFVNEQTQTINMRTKPEIQEFRPAFSELNISEGFEFDTEMVTNEVNFWTTVFYFVGTLESWRE